MTPAKWQEFYHRLEARLQQLSQRVEVDDDEMGSHYDRMADSIQQTVKEVVPPRKKFKFNGREVSAETKRLYDLRVRDFASGRAITKSDRDAWNRTLNGAAKKDYHKWVENRIKEIEEADEKGDSKAINQGARVMAGKSKHQPSPQSAKKDKGKGDMIQTSEELGELWQQFLAGKFKASELEAARDEWEPGAARHNKTRLTHRRRRRVSRGHHTHEKR